MGGLLGHAKWIVRCLLCLHVGHVPPLQLRGFRQGRALALSDQSSPDSTTAGVCLWRLASFLLLTTGARSITGVVSAGKTPDWHKRVTALACAPLLGPVASSDGTVGLGMAGALVRQRPWRASGRGFNCLCAGGCPIGGQFGRRRGIQGRGGFGRMIHCRKQCAMVWGGGVSFFPQKTQKVGEKKKGGVFFFSRGGG